MCRDDSDNNSKNDNKAKMDNDIKNDNKSNLIVMIAKLTGQVMTRVIVITRQAILRLIVFILVVWLYML